jgi:hypothetical protein
MYPVPPRPATQGSTESILGEWLAKKPRDKLVAATKIASSGRPIDLDSRVSLFDGFAFRYRKPNVDEAVAADDPTVAHAFNTKVNPFGAQLNAFWASDSGHWDVPDLTEVLAETWSLVERGALTEANFRDLVFTHPFSFFAGKNPSFFEGTAVEAALKRKAA